MTQASSIIGSPLYMSPEQMQSPHDVDELSDVWSLGTILYELIVGSAPFEAATMPALCARICTGNATPMREKLAEGESLSHELEGAVMRCLERDRSKRWGSVAELAERIALHGSPDNTLSVHRAMRMTVNAGLPFRADGSTGDVEGRDSFLPEEVDRLSDGGSPHSANRPVSFVPKPIRSSVGWSRTRVFAGGVAVLFVGTLIGAWISTPREGSRTFIAGAPAVVMARAGESLELSKANARLGASAPKCGAIGDNGAERAAENSGDGLTLSADSADTSPSASAASSPAPIRQDSVLVPKPLVKGATSARPRADDILRDR